MEELQKLLSHLDEMGFTGYTSAVIQWVSAKGLGEKEINEEILPTVKERFKEACERKQNKPAIGVNE